MANVVSITSTTNTSLVVLWTLKQTTKYNIYYIWIKKPWLQIKFNLALLEAFGIDSLLLTMNHFLIKVLRKEANFLMPHCFIWCKCLLMLHLSAFECLCIPNFRHLMYVLQINLEPIPFQECMHFNLGYCQSLF